MYRTAITTLFLFGSIPDPLVDCMIYKATGMHLTALPSIPTGSTNVDLSYNQFSIIGHQWFAPYLNLELLIMDHNKITYVDPEAFLSTQSIYSLSLADNLLTSIPDLRVLSTSLASLNLNSNPLENTENDTMYLYGLSHLRELHMSFTNINSMRPVKRMAYNRLQLFRISTANLSDIGELHHFNYLYLLDLTDNDFIVPFLTNQTFVGMDLLGTLHLTDLGLTEFPTQVLAPVKNTLAHLQLDRNAIKYINSSQVEGFVLQTIHINYNRLTQFPNLFPIRTTLSQLNVRYGLFNSIPVGTFAGFDHLMLLAISSNINLKYIPYLGNGSANIQFLSAYSLALQNLSHEQFRQFTGLQSLTINSGYGQKFPSLDNFTVLNRTLETFKGSYGLIGTVSRYFIDNMQQLKVLSLRASRVDCFEEVSSTVLDHIKMYDK